VDGPLADLTRNGRVARPLVVLQDEGGVDVAARAVRLHGVGETADGVRVPAGALHEELPPFGEHHLRVLLREVHHGTAHGAVFVGGETLAEDVVLPEELFAVEVVFGADGLDRDHFVDGCEVFGICLVVRSADEHGGGAHEAHDLVTVVADELALEAVDAHKAHDDQRHGDDFFRLRQNVFPSAQEQEQDEGYVHKALRPPQAGDDRQEREEERVLPGPFRFVFPRAEQHDEHGELYVDIHAEPVAGELVREHRRQQERQDLHQRVRRPEGDAPQVERALELRDHKGHTERHEDVL